ncbi:integrase catalytic domain-containing protein [Trichonephila clavipes]|nr:integrase catalytic domain-containing protein [Trichonephila clavipes]
MGIQKRHISSYSAHVNGRVEKPNQSLANILASISQNTNDWDDQLPHTMLALNSAIHEATYTSPFFLEHGRDIRLSYTYEKNSDTPQNKRGLPSPPTAVATEIQQNFSDGFSFPTPCFLFLRYGAVAMRLGTHKFFWFETVGRGSGVVAKRIWKCWTRIGREFSLVVVSLLFEFLWQYLSDDGAANIMDEHGQNPS